MYHNALRSSLQASVQSLLAALISTRNDENTIRNAKSKSKLVRKKRKYLIVEFPSRNLSKNEKAPRTPTLTGLERAPRKQRERERGGCEIGDFWSFRESRVGKSVFESE